MNKFIKVFIGTGAPFAIILGLFFCLQFGIYFGILSGFAAGICFGFIMASLLWITDRLFGNREDCRKNNKGVKQSAELSMELSFEKVFELCLKSLEKIKKCEIKEAEQSKGIITAHSGTTWKTWGEIINFEIVNNEDSKKTCIKISSSPLVSTTLVDFGKNYENVKKISDFLKEKGGK
jgi:hypothetical protein